MPHTSDIIAHIYLLTDKTGIRYVGVSVNPTVRLKHHRYESLDVTRRSYNFPKSKWLRKVGNSVRLRVLWSGPEHECYAREHLVIQECRTRGHKILNIAEGGHRPPRINMLQDSASIRAKISAARKGTRASIETRQKMSESHRGKHAYLLPWNTSEGNGANKPVVRCLLDGTEIERYRSSRVAAQAVGVKFQSICDALKGRSKTSGGYVWKYA